MEKIKGTRGRKPLRNKKGNGNREPSNGLRQLIPRGRKCSKYRSLGAWIAFFHQSAESLIEEWNGWWLARERNDWVDKSRNHKWEGKKKKQRKLCECKVRMPFQQETRLTILISFQHSVSSHPKFYSKFFIHLIMSDSINASWQRFSGITALTSAELLAAQSVFHRAAFEALDISEYVTLRESAEIVYNEEGEESIRDNFTVGTVVCFPTVACRG